MFLCMFYTFICLYISWIYINQMLWWSNSLWILVSLFLLFFFCPFSFMFIDNYLNQNVIIFVVRFFFASNIICFQLQHLIGSYVFTYIHIIYNMYNNHNHNNKNKNNQNTIRIKWWLNSIFNNATRLKTK